MRKLFVVVLLAASLPVFLTACAGSAATPPPVSTSIHVTMADYAFTPNAFTVPVGALISFSAFNNGPSYHNFMIMPKGKQVQGHYSDAADLVNNYWFVLVPAGQTRAGTLTAPSEPGEYQIISGDYAGKDFDHGMVARLFVVGSAMNGTPTP